MIALSLYLWTTPGLANPLTIQFNIETSPTVSFWTFVKTIGDFDRHPSTAMQDIFLKSKYGTDLSIKSKLAELRHIHEVYFNQSYDFRGYPAAKGELGWDIDHHFDYQATQSKDLTEFKSRTLLLLPLQEQSKFFQDLAVLKPIYEELIGIPSEHALNEYRERLKQAWDKGHLSDLLTKAALFYHANWQTGADFSIHLIPIPAGTGKGHSSVIGNVILVDAFLEEKDLSLRASLVFHEFCHAAALSQSVELQKQITAWFEKNTSPLRSYAQSLLEEGLATALSSGLAYKAVAGKEDLGPWSDTEEYDRGSKAEIDLIRSYVNLSKPIDEVFIDRWVENYAKKFPDALTSPTVRLRHTLLMLDESVMNLSEAKSQIKKATRINVLTGHSLSSNDRLMTDFEDSLLMIVGNKDSELEIESLSKALPVMKVAVPLYKKLRGPGVIAAFAKDRPILLFKVDKGDDFKDLLRRVLLEKGLPSEPKIIID